MTDYLPEHPYSKLLKQKLELWMFTPCKLVDGVWVVLEEPKRWNEYLEFPESFDGNKEWYEFYEYEEAKDRVLFEGFSFDRDSDDYYFLLKDGCYMNLISKNNPVTIESVINKDWELTKNAQKQIGL